MKEKIIISIDGSIFYGWKSASRVLLTTDKWLFVKAHRYKGVFEHKGRKVKVLNFSKVSNYERFNHLLEIQKKNTRKYEKSEHGKAHRYTHNKEYREANRDAVNANYRKYYEKNKEKIIAQKKLNQTIKKLKENDFIQQSITN